MVVDGVVDADGELLLTADEAAALLHLPNVDRLHTHVTNGRLHIVQPASKPTRSGRGRSPTKFYSATQVQCLRDAQLRDLGAVDNKILDVLRSAENRVQELELEVERLRAQVAALDLPSDTAASRALEFEGERDALATELADLQDAHRAALKALRQLTRHGTKMTEMYLRKQAPRRPL